MRRWTVLPFFLSKFRRYCTLISAMTCWRCTWPGSPTHRPCSWDDAAAPGVLGLPRALRGAVESLPGAVASPPRDGVLAPYGGYKIWPNATVPPGLIPGVPVPVSPMLRCLEPALVPQELNNVEGARGPPFNLVPTGLGDCTCSSCMVLHYSQSTRTGLCRAVSGSAHQDAYEINYYCRVPYRYEVDARFGYRHKLCHEMNDGLLLRI